MESLYQCDLAYVHSVAFETLARGAAPEIIRRLQISSAPVRKVMDAGCGAGPMTKALEDAGFDVTGVDTSAERLRLAIVGIDVSGVVGQRLTHGNNGIVIANFCVVDGKITGHPSIEISPWDLNFRVADHWPTSRSEPFRSTRANGRSAAIGS